MNIFKNLRRMRGMGGREIVSRILGKFRNRMKGAAQRFQEEKFSTYCLRPPAWLDAGLENRMEAPVIPENAELRRPCIQWADHFLEHRFDLLGSGWTHVRHGMTCAGLEGRAFPPTGLIPDREGRWLERINRPNRKESLRLWKLLDPDYIPIDWQLDFKSGFRWNEGAWYGSILYGSLPGADVKVPWELSRMQHLTQLAWAAVFSAGEKTPSTSRKYLDEIRNQLLDFMATNPPAFGVNWACTMDVAIRAANWLLAYDIVKSAGLGWNPEFEKILARSIHEHGTFIIRHLEWSPGLRGNHYLADIAGLAFVAAHLPPSSESDAWLRFSASEFSKEFSLQFHEDGSNFEGSTAYHRLSTEMAVYTAALLAGLPEPRRRSLQTLDPAQWQRLHKALEFMRDVIRPDGPITQIGDNDSGRFFKVQPAVSANDGGLKENALDVRHLISAGNGLYPPPRNQNPAGPFLLDEIVIQSLSRGQSPPPPETPVQPQQPDGEWRLRAYPDFGLFLYRREGDYLAFRCGSVGQRGNGGHAHNDQLSFELAVRGEAFIVDPGTYLYTPDWKQRNKFRSTASHNTLAVEGCEQNPWETGRNGLFSLREHAKARIVQVNRDSIEGLHRGFSQVHRRCLKLGDGLISFEEDLPASGSQRLFFHSAPGIRPSLGESRVMHLQGKNTSLRIHAERGEWKIEDSHFSPGYGVIVPGTRAILAFSGQDPLKWYIEWTHS